MEDAATIYAIPQCFMPGASIPLSVNGWGSRHHRRTCPECKRVSEALLNPQRTLRIAMVGKYMELMDAYKSSHRP